jgi:hypothetical protein
VIHQDYITAGAVRKWAGKIAAWSNKKTIYMANIDGFIQQVEIKKFD